MHSPLACLNQLRYFTWQDCVAYLAWKGQDGALKPPVVEHRFEDDWYVRTVRLPQSTYLVGRPHRGGHIIKLVQGSVLLAHELGQKYIQAPDVMHSVDGYQMVVLCRTDVVGETWHFNPDQIRDVDVLEDMFFYPAEPVLARGKEVADIIASGQLPSSYYEAIKDSA